MFKSIVVAALLCSAGVAGANTPAQTPPWAALAQADIDFVYQSIRDNHPGAIDSENAYFRQWMEDGYRSARADAARARSYADMRRLLQRYFAGFADGHLWLTFHHGTQSVRWTGMVVARQGTAYRIVHGNDEAGKALAAARAELVSCDGRPVDTIVDEDILPGIMNNRELAWVRHTFAANVLLSDEALPHKEFASCVVKDATGSREIALKWRDVSRTALYEALDKAVPTVDRHSSIAKVGPRSYWVRLPEFQPNREQEAEIKQVTAQIAKLRNAELIVFDLRGNRGGNSQWGSDVLEGLFGKPYMRQLNARRDTGYAEWRASPDNLRYVADDILPRITRQFGADNEDVASWRAFAGRMRLAVDKGVPFVRQSEAAASAPAAANPQPLSRARIALITKSGCASSCLDFVDEVLGLPGTIHLGETTGADTVYMDVRRVELPSGLGRFVLSQKVYRGRARAHNAAYVPAHQFDGAIGDTKRVQAWTLKRLAK